METYLGNIYGNTLDWIGIWVTDQAQKLIHRWAT